MTDVEEPEVMLSTKNPDLRIVVDLYCQLQKARIAMGNRKGAIERGADTGDTTWLASWSDRLEPLEGELAKDMGRLLADHPAWTWLKTVRGIGPTLAGKVVALIDDISKFDNISNLWSFAGYGLHPDENGILVIQRYKKGEKATYSKRLKTTIYLVGNSFRKCGGKFADIYFNAVDYYIQNRPKWTLPHQRAAALRKTEKIFLACLWLAWRKAEGLEVRPPYIIGKNGHQTMYNPEDFSEKVE